MKHFKTKKGTELPILDLRGKDYLQVAHRLVWFREEHPDWTITTEYIQLSDDHAVAKATVSDQGIVIATGHKCEDRKGFQDFIEKAETGAIGRALAACGFGTQFAPDLDEGERLADSPTVRAKPVVSDAINAVRTQNTVDYKPTEKQVKRLFAIAKKCGWSNGDVKSYLAKLGIEHSKDLNFIQYETLIKNMESFPKETDFDTKDFDAFQSDLTQRIERDRA